MTLPRLALSDICKRFDGFPALDGVTAALRGPADARARGIGMVHQHFRLVRPFTVAENLVLALGGKAAMRGALALAADRLGFALDPDRRVDSLSVAEQQQVEIVKAMAGGARLLILDEPTAVLTDAEAERLLSTVRGIAATGT
ncbi:MAG: ATP-binding cassette domain-containing protein, partial [Ferrovibrionaceae bacterium]